MNIDRRVCIFLMSEGTTYFNVHPKTSGLFCWSTTAVQIPHIPKRHPSDSNWHSWDHKTKHFVAIRRNDIATIMALIISPPASFLHACPFAWSWQLDFLTLEKLGKLIFLGLTFASVKTLEYCILISRWASFQTTLFKILFREESFRCLRNFRQSFGQPCGLYSCFILTSWNWSIYPSTNEVTLTA